MIHTQPPNTIHRYTGGERITHWGLALGFLLAGLSGYALFHPALFWMSSLTGGGTWSRILHPYFGLYMLFTFTILAWWVRHDNKMDELDWAWLKHMDKVVKNNEEGLPEVGRYNAGQKMLYVALSLCMAGLLISGIIMWRSVFSKYFSPGTIRVASLVHALAAFALMLLVIVHVYSSFWIKGSIDAMLKGWVTPGWAYRHHRRWYRKHLRGETPHSHAK
jgi:formate dehydrogenase subunit gamma